MEKLIRLSILRAKTGHMNSLGFHRLYCSSRWHFNICRNCKRLSTTSRWDRRHLQQKESLLQAPASSQLSSCTMLNIEKGVRKPFSTSSRCRKDENDKNKEKIKENLDAIAALEEELSLLKEMQKKKNSDFSRYVCDYIDNFVFPVISEIKDKIKNGKRLAFSEKYLLFLGNYFLKAKKQPNKNIPQTPPVGFLITLTIMLFMLAIGSEQNKPKKSHISQFDFLNHVLPTGQVQRITIKPNGMGMQNDTKGPHMFTAEIFLAENAIIKGKLMPESSSYYIALTDAGAFEQQVRDKERELGILMQDGLEIQYSKNDRNVLSALVGTLIVILGLTLLLASLGQKEAGNVSKKMKMGSLSNPFAFMSAAKYIRADEQVGSKITFKDVAGLDEAKVEVMEFVDFLKHPDKYKKLGGKMPRGALLLGPPGCGKTLLARAVAAEADVPFLAMAGSQFVEMIGGLGASRVRDLFEDAKERSPCVVFIDEIDAIGSKRSDAVSLQESDHTLNQLLVELDGMGTDKDIICLAATNRAQDLDKALLRPGRLSRHINIGLPTEKEREDIFKVYLKKLKKLEEDIDDLASWLAKLTTGRSGADVAHICNEAALHAAREEQTSIKRRNFEYAADRTMLGVAKKRSLISQEEKHMIAYHESGHTLVSWMMKTTNPILKMSIVERIGQSLGMAQVQLKEKFLTTNVELFENMCVGLGGRAAEMIVFNKLTSGARGDIKNVTDIAYQQVQQFGMNKTVGLVSFPKPKFGTKEGYSRHLKTMMDHEVQKLIVEAYKTAEQVLRDNEDKLHKLAAELLKKETLTYHEIVQLIGPPVGQRLSEEAQMK